MKFVIFWQSRIYGGAERQLALLAVKLSRTNKVVVVDSVEGVVHDMIKSEVDIRKSAIEFIVFEGDKLSFENCVVITPATNCFMLNRYLRLTSCEVRFWFMHSLNLTHMYLSNKLPYRLGGIYKKIFYSYYRKKIMLIKDGLFFQALGGLEGVESFYKIKLNRKHVTGMVVDLKVPQIPNNIGHNYKKKLVWLGRLDKGTKLILIKKILNDYKKNQLSEKGFSFDVIAFGDGVQAFNDYVVELGLQDSVNFMGEIKFENLKYYLEDAFLLFAQGTSVYEGLRCNVPVIQLDFLVNSEFIDSYQYKLFSEVKGHELGYLITDAADSRISEGNDLEYLINSLSESDYRQKILKESSIKVEEMLIAEQNSLKFLVQERGAVVSNCPSSNIDILFFRLRTILIKYFNKV